MAPTTQTPEILETAKADGTHAVVVGRYRVCRVRPDPLNEGHYVRVTQNASKHGRRYHFHSTYEAALDAAMTWANRKPTVMK